MALRDTIQNKAVYFDTNVFIYLLEGNRDFARPILDIQALTNQGKIQIFSSALVYTELLPPHAKQKNQQGIETLIAFLSSFNLVAVTKKILIHAGILRGETGMRTPDAIHVATAVASGCDVFLTNDKSIRTPESLEKVLLSEHQ